MGFDINPDYAIIVPTGGAPNHYDEDERPGHREGRDVKDLDAVRGDRGEMNRREDVVNVMDTKAILGTSLRLPTRSRSF